MLLLEDGAGPAAGLLLFALGLLNFGAIFGAIWEGIKWLAGKVADLAIFLAHAAVQAGHQIWNVMIVLARHAKQFAFWVKDRVVQLWQLKIQPLVRTVWTALQRAQQFLYRHLGWAIRAVSAVAKFLADVWRFVVAPILTALDWARGVMRLLALLGVDWAAAVEKWLAALQLKIYNAFLWLQGIVNQISTWLDFLLTPAGLIRGYLLIASLDPILGAVMRALVRRGVAPWHAEEKVEQGKRTPSRSAGEILQDVDSGRVAQSPQGNVILAHALRVLGDAGHK